MAGIFMNLCPDESGQPRGFAQIVLSWTRGFFSMELSPRDFPFKPRYTAIDRRRTPCDDKKTWNRKRWHC